MTLDVAQLDVRTEASGLEDRRRFYTVALVAANVAFALVPALIGTLALLGVLR